MAIDGAPLKVTARVAPRLGDDGESDLLTDELAATQSLSQISPANVSFPAPFFAEQIGSAHTRAGTIDARAPELDVLKRRWRGRIVVMAERMGTDFVEDEEATQPIFLKVVDMTAIHGPVPTG